MYFAIFVAIVLVNNVLSVRVDDEPEHLPTLLKNAGQAVITQHQNLQHASAVYQTAREQVFDADAMFHKAEHAAIDKGAEESVAVNAREAALRMTKAAVATHEATEVAVAKASHAKECVHLAAQKDAETRYAQSEHKRTADEADEAVIRSRRMAEQANLMAAQAAAQQAQFTAAADAARQAKAAAEQAINDVEQAKAALENHMAAPVPELVMPTKAPM